MEHKIEKTTIKLYLGDITDLSLDAIVNAANSALQLGGGVAGAIRRRGGPRIQEECNKIGGTPVGTAVITTGGNLKARHVIHAVGPRYGEGDEDEKLRRATLNSLRLTDEHNLRSIAFPAISTGIFGFPLDRAARIMVHAVKEYLAGLTGLELVIFALYDKKAYQAFERELTV
jgi:O-acetyl-ADP-ribose deacetylase (regulator of RNase III)